MPVGLRPMLATIGRLPGKPGWSYEIKWDGVRTLAYLSSAGVKLESRNLKDFTPRYPEIAGEPPASIAGRQLVLDGEIVAFDERGRVSFGALQHRMHLTSERDVRRRMGTHPVAFMVFDVLWMEGSNLMSAPYEERRGVLESLGLLDGLWRVPPSIGPDPDDGLDLLEASRAQGMEGVVAKRMGSVYEPGRRSRAWLKVKNQVRQEMVIGGWLPGLGNREGTLGALLVGYQGEGGLRFAGRVGTGFTFAMLRELLGRLEPLRRETSPFVETPRLPAARWAEPRLVAEVGFSEWTAAATLRHPVFLGLRDDADPARVVREPVLGEN